MCSGFLFSCNKFSQDFCQGPAYVLRRYESNAPWSLGRIQSGMVTVNRIGQVETGSDDRPVDDVKIINGRVE